VGFFESLLEKDPNRKIIPLSLEHAPRAVAGFQGFDLQLPPELLPQSISDFNLHNEVAQSDPLVSLLQSWQNEVDVIQREMGFTPGHHSRADAVSTVKAIRLAVFPHMRTKIEAVIKPQKQVTVKSTGAELKASDINLPMNALLVPTGGSSMSIFGLADEELSWEKFLSLTAGPHQDSWREAITSVIMSGHGRINVDNSQVILSADESKAYRIVLTTASKFWDDRIEFSLYFVETLKREDHGDEDTTRLLKGLQTVCRYRFLFLEQSSIFSAENILASSDERLVQLAGKLLGELNLMRQESRDIDLASQAYWTKVIGGTGMREMHDEFYPREKKVRELCGQVLKARDKPDVLVTVRTELSSLIGDLDRVTCPFNKRLI
jgi:hypothetical protein